MPPKKQEQQREDKQVLKELDRGKELDEIRRREIEAKRCYEEGRYRDAFDALSEIYFNVFRDQYRSYKRSKWQPSFFLSAEQRGVLTLFREMFEVALKARLEFSLLFFVLDPLLNSLTDPAVAQPFTKNIIFPQLFTLEGSSRYLLRFLRYREPQIMEYLGSLEPADITSDNAEAIAGLVANLLRKTPVEKADTAAQQEFIAQQDRYAACAVGFLNAELVTKGIIARLYYGAKNDYDKDVDKEVMCRIVNTPEIFAKFARHSGDICRIIATYGYFRNFANTILSKPGIYEKATFTWAQLFMLFKTAGIVETIDEFNKSSDWRLKKILKDSKYSALDKTIDEESLPILRNDLVEGAEASRREALVADILTEVRRVIALPPKCKFSLMSVALDSPLPDAKSIKEKFLPMLIARKELDEMTGRETTCIYVISKPHGGEPTCKLLTEDQDISVYSGIIFHEDHVERLSLKAEAVTELMCVDIESKGGGFGPRSVEGAASSSILPEQLRKNMVMVARFEEELRTQLEEGREVLPAYLRYRFRPCEFSSPEARDRLYNFILERTSTFRHEERNASLVRARVIEPAGPAAPAVGTFEAFLHTPWRY